MTTTTPIGSARPRAAPLPWGEALGAWVVARVLVGLGYAIADGVESVLDVGRLLHLHQGLITWDGTFYWAIAHDGYDGGEGLRFFPLYPMLSRLLAVPTGGRTGLALVVVANAAAFACLVLLFRLVLAVSGDRALARRSMWFLALFPAAGAFVLAYSESMMLALTLGVFWVVRDRRWWWAAGLGYLAGLTRPAAALLVVPVAVEAWSARRDLRVGAALAAVAAPVAGVLTFLFWVGGAYGDWQRPIDIQRELRAGFQDPVTRLWDGVTQVASTSQLDAANIGFALLFCVLLVVAIRTQPAAWWSYAAVTLVVALSARNIDSMGRYGLVAFPFVVALARVGDDERVGWGLVALSGGGLVALSAMTALGTYTP